VSTATGFYGGHPRFVGRSRGGGGLPERGGKRRTLPGKPGGVLGGISVHRGPVLRNTQLWSTKTRKKRGETMRQAAGAKNKGMDGSGEVPPTGKGWFGETLARIAWLLREFDDKPEAAVLLRSATREEGRRRGPPCSAPRWSRLLKEAGKEGEDRR